MSKENKKEEKTKEKSDLSTGFKDSTLPHSYTPISWYLDVAFLPYSDLPTLAVTYTTLSRLQPSVRLVRLNKDRTSDLTCSLHQSVCVVTACSLPGIVWVPR